MATSRSITCWICSSLAPCLHHHNHCCVSPEYEFESFNQDLVFGRSLAGTAASFFMLRGALQRSRLVNNSLEQPPDRGIGQRPRIRALHIPQNFVLARRLIDRQSLQMFLVADLQRAMRALVQQRHEFQINFIYVAAPIIDAHDGFSLPAGIPRWLTPDLPACFKVRIKFATASAARSGVAAFSISATIAEPTTAASAMPPSTETCVGSEIPNPTAIGKRVCCRTRRTSAGKSSGNASRVPVTPVREIKYKKPEDAAAIFASRSSVEVGAAKKNRVETVRTQNRAILAGLFRRQIGNQHAVCSRFRRLGRKFLQPHLQNRIEVAEKHERHIAAAPKPRDQIQNSRQRGAASQRAFAGALNRRPVGQRIAERHAQLDHVGPASAAASTIFSVASSVGSPAVR